MTIHLTLLCAAPTYAQKSMNFPGNDVLDAQIDMSHGEITIPDRINKNNFFMSPSASAIETARQLHLKCKVENNLRECNYGDWAGLSLKDIAKTQPEAFKDWLSDPYFSAHGGETIRDIYIRTQNWLKSINLLSQDCFALTHASIIRCVLMMTQSRPLEHYFKIDVAPLSLLRINLNE